MKIKLVKQEDPKGCAIACIATVLGRTYAEVAQHFHPSFRDGGIKFEHTIEYLGEQGMRLLRCQIIANSADVRLRETLLMPFAPVHLVRMFEFTDTENGHLVVMDDRGRFHCPDGMSDTEIRGSYLFTDCLGIWPR